MMPLPRMIPILLALTIIGCGIARRGEPFDDPIFFTEESLRQGHESFMRHCNQCHPQGEGGLGPAIDNKLLPGWAMHFRVRQGLGPMPSFTDEEIPEEEPRRIIAYLNRLQAMPGPGERHLGIRPRPSPLRRIAPPRAKRYLRNAMGQDGRESNARLLRGSVRAFAGAVIFGLPLYMTMELWRPGFYLESWPEAGLSFRRDPSEFDLRLIPKGYELP